MKPSTWLLLALMLIVACAPAGGQRAAPSPAAPQQTIPVVTPQGNSFYGLPTFHAGETAEFDGYSITLAGVELDGSELSLTLDLENETERVVDLAWAVQLFYGSEYVPPVERAANEAATLAPASTLSNVWRYDLSAMNVTGPATAPDDGALADYLLLYAPRGWSGPVIVYRLDAPR